MKQSKLQIKMYQRGLTGIKMAEQTGYTPTHISRVLNGGHDGGIKFWNKAAQVLKCSVKDIKEVE